MKTRFKCDKCGCEPEELWMFSNFGNNPAKIADEKEYCHTCFQEVDNKYEQKYQPKTPPEQLLPTGS